MHCLVQGSSNSPPCEFDRRDSDVRQPVRSARARCRCGRNFDAGIAILVSHHFCGCEKNSVAFLLWRTDTCIVSCHVVVVILHHIMHVAACRGMLSLYYHRPIRPCPAKPTQCESALYLESSMAVRAHTDCIALYYLITM